MEIEAPAKAANDALKAIAGVRKVVRGDSDEGWVKFTVKVESNTDVREQIAGMALKQNWRIRELSKRTASLEDVFVELTHADMTH